MKLRNLFIIFLCLFCSGVFAKDPPPLALIKQISAQTLNELQKYKGKLRDKETVQDIVKRVVMPHFDLTSVSRSIIGRDYWYKASERTRNRFVQTFTNYVIDMYTWILASYDNEILSFKPIRDFDPSQTRIWIYSIVHRPGSKSISLNYHLIKRGNTWKIYDLSVNGVSMVQSYRAQYIGALGYLNWPVNIFGIYKARG